MSMQVALMHSWLVVFTVEPPTQTEEEEGREEERGRNHETLLQSLVQCDDLLTDYLEFRPLLQLHPPSLYNWDKWPFEPCWLMY